MTEFWCIYAAIALVTGLIFSQLLQPSTFTFSAYEPPNQAAIILASLVLGLIWPLAWLLLVVV